MRYNRLNLTICVLVALFWHCERNDVITGAGANVVQDMDTSLTDTRGGFVLLNLGISAVDSVFSLPASPNPAWSTQILAGGRIFVGINRDGDTLTAHSQFRARPFAASGNTPPYSETDSLIGAYLYFRAVDTCRSFDSISVYSACTLAIDGWLRPVNRADFLGEESGQYVDGPTPIGRFMLNGEVDSIYIPDSIAEKIFEARVNADTSAAYTFAFNIVDYYGNPVNIRAPYVVAHIARHGKNNARDTVLGVSRITAFENMNDGRDTLPYSSQYTLRTAVFRINVGSIVDTLGPDRLNMLERNGELLNAVAMFRIDTTRTREIGGEILTFTANIGNYSFLALDTYLTDDHHTDTSKSIRHRFARTGMLRPTTPHNIFDIRPPLRNIVSGQNDNQYIYIYLRSVADNNTVLWEPQNKVVVEAVFTPSRAAQRLQ